MLPSILCFLIATGCDSYVPAYTCPTDPLPILRLPTRGFSAPPGRGGRKQARLTHPMETLLSWMRGVGCCSLGAAARVAAVIQDRGRWDAGQYFRIEGDGMREGESEGSEVEI
jgi:hypothetical protein